MKEKSLSVNNSNLPSATSVDIQDLGLYIHIPFCAKKCDYCDFLSAPASQEVIDNYFTAMLAEIEQYQGGTDSYIVPSIFIGGGTPSVVEPIYIEQVMEAISRVFHVDKKRLEATIEINPGTVTEEKLRTYLRVGINRISFGLQSTNDEELSMLGRIHTYEQFEENYRLARYIGFQNINIDLMSALPGQTLSSWENTLNKVIELKPEHISAYSLIIEEGTKFYERYHDDSNEAKDLPDEETDRMIYLRTKELLQESGYHRYEISNYAIDNYESRHNSSYWIGTDYLGIGLGASSLIEGARFSNMEDLDQYIKLCNLYRENDVNLIHDYSVTEQQNKTLKDVIGFRRNYEQLTLKQRMEEFMFLGLRMCDGISKDRFFQRFGVGINDVYGVEIERLVKDKLLSTQGDCIKLTDYGIDISNFVLSSFIQD